MKRKKEKKTTYFPCADVDTSIPMQLSRPVNIAKESWSATPADTEAGDRKLAWRSKAGSLQYLKESRHIPGTTKPNLGLLEWTLDFQTLCANGPRLSSTVSRIILSPFWQLWEPALDFLHFVSVWVCWCDCVDYFVLFVSSISEFNSLLPYFLICYFCFWHNDWQSLMSDFKGLDER